MILRPGAPVLSRGRGRVQVGIARAVRFDGLAREEERFLASLEDRRVAVGRAERARFGQLIADLEGAGLGEPRGASGPLPRSVVRFRSVDSVTLALARALASAGLGALSATDGRPAARAAIFGHADAGRSRSGALARAVIGDGPLPRWASEHEQADVEVLRGLGAADPVALRDLVARDTPHLAIVGDEEGLRVGPLVVPGATPCETCLGIGRSERDREWPLLAIQLGGVRARAEEVPADAALLAAGHAARLILSHLWGTAPSGETWRVPYGGGQPRVSTAAAHPDCGCGAAAEIGDVQAARRAAMPAGCG